MAVTYVIYTPGLTVSATISRAAALLSEGREELDRAFQSINAATNGGATKDNLIGGPDFGALNSANAALMYDQTFAAYNLLNSIDAGGYRAAIASLYKGMPG